MAEAVKEEKIIGNGLSKKQAKKIRMATMSKKEIAYLRRKALIEKVWMFCYTLSADLYDKLCVQGSFRYDGSNGYVDTPKPDS